MEGEFMKKTLSYVLMFSLCFFSFFSTGCKSSSSSSIFGAIVTGTIVAATGGSSAAVFAANLRGTAVKEVKVDKVNLTIYRLNNAKANLRGEVETGINNLTISNGKFEFTTPTIKAGEYLFEVTHANTNITFLRDLLTIQGNTTKENIEISPETEIKTAIYKNWVETKAPTNSTFANFEANIKEDKTLEKNIEKDIKAKAETYLTNLVTWSADTTKEVTVVEVDSKDIPDENLTGDKKEEENADSEFLNNLPTTLKTYSWRNLNIKDVDGQFNMLYQKHNGNWIKVIETTKDSISPPYVFFNPGTLPDGGLDITGDLHEYIESFYTWLYKKAANSKVTLPAYTSEEYKNFLDGRDDEAILLGRFMYESITMENSIISMIPGNTAIPTAKFNAKIAEKDSKRYLYMKNTSGGEFAERIYMCDY